MSQEQEVLKHLKRGWHSGRMLLERTGSIDYRARISELRRNWIVQDKWESVGKARFKMYRVVGRRKEWDGTGLL
jgi:hypothetical protein